MSSTSRNAKAVALLLAVADPAVAERLAVSVTEPAVKVPTYTHDEPVEYPSVSPYADPLFSVVAPFLINGT